MYTISLDYSWSGPSTLTQVFSFTVIDPCVSEVTPPASIADATVEFSPDPLAVTLVGIQPTINPVFAPYCFFDIAVTKDHDGVPDTTMIFVSFIDLIQAGFLTHPVIDVSLINGVYDVT